MIEISSVPGEVAGWAGPDLVAGSGCSAARRRVAWQCGAAWPAGSAGWAVWAVGVGPVVAGQPGLVVAAAAAVEPAPGDAWRPAAACSAAAGSGAAADWRPVRDSSSGRCCLAGAPPSAGCLALGGSCSCSCPCPCRSSVALVLAAVAAVVGAALPASAWPFVFGAPAFAAPWLGFVPLRDGWLVGGKERDVCVWMQL